MSRPDEEGFAQRAAARASWPGGKTTLSVSLGDEDLSDSTTLEQRLGMMWGLASSVWALMGTPAADYTRAQMPGRVIRAGDR